MKTLTTLFNKVFKSRKHVELTEAELDAWIVSIRQKPQFSNISFSAHTSPVKHNDDLEAGNLVLA